jgi:hypothetical protein
MYYRVILDVTFHDLLIEAESEEAASRIAHDWAWKVRPFGGCKRVSKARVRKPWKKQLEKLNEQKT